MTAANAQKPEPEPPRCRLLSLPAELRNRIYFYVMCNKILPVTIGKEGIYRSSKPGPLSCTCRRIRDESLAVYFKGNSFRFIHQRATCAKSSKSLYIEDYGWLGDYIDMMKRFYIEIGYSDHIRIDVNAQTMEFSVELVDGRYRDFWQVVDIRKASDADVKLLGIACAFLDGVAAEARDQGLALRLNKHILAALFVRIENEIDTRQKSITKRSGR